MAGKTTCECCTQLRAEVERLLAKVERMGEVIKAAHEDGELVLKVDDATGKLASCEWERDQIRAEVEKVKESEIYFEKKYKGLLCDYVDSFTALEKGAESMRERAAEVAEAIKFTVAKDATDKLHNYTCGKVAEAIRAIPLKENEG